MDQAVNIAKALSDRNRMRILCFLEGGELCVCQIVEVLQLAHSTTSKHLAILAEAGLLRSRKRGRWAYYGLPEWGSRPEVLESVAWVHRTLREDPQVLRDRQCREGVLAMTPEELCRRQARGRACCP